MIAAPYSTFESTEGDVHFKITSLRDLDVSTFVGALGLIAALMLKAAD